MNNPASHTSAPITANTNSTDPTLDVPEADQLAYLETSYRDYLLLWRRLRRGLDTARRTGDHASETRFARELSTLWPRPEAIARAAGIWKLTP